MLEIRRFKDIVAFREGEQSPFAFHARNMETAEMTEEAWQSLSPANFLTADFQGLKVLDDASQEIQEWETSENPEAQPEPLKFTIRSLTINVTQICNLHCTYCAAGGDGTYGEAVSKISIEKTLPQIKFFLDQLGTGSSFHISFLGGEPLLYPEAMKAIADYTKAEASKKEISTSFKVTTNGTLLTKKNINMLNDIGCQVVISLDGPAEINDIRRPGKAGKASTEKILQGIQLLSTQRNSIPRVELHAVMDENHYDVLNTYKYFSRLPVDRFEFTFSVNDSTTEASQKFVESFEKAAAVAFSQGGEKELRRLTLFDRYFDILDAQVRIENHCGLGKTLAVVDAKNRLFNCPWTVGDSRHQIGKEQDLNYDVIERYSQNLVDMNRCQDCWARFLCGGGCSFVHQSMDGKNINKRNDFCFRTRYLTAVVLKYYSLIRGSYGEEKGEPHGQEQTH